MTSYSDMFCPVLLWQDLLIWNGKPKYRFVLFIASLRKMDLSRTGRMCNERYKVEGICLLYKIVNGAIEVDIDNTLCFC